MKKWNSFTRSVTPSPSPSPRHSSVRPSHLPLQVVAATRPVDPGLVHRLAPHRGMLHSRQASSNSNQQSSLDDSGVVDDHEGDHDGEDVTSAEEHERREHRADRQERLALEHRRLEGEKQEQRQSAPPPVTVAVRTTNREIRVLKCNGIKTKKHNMYTLPPDYLSHIVVLGQYQKFLFSFIFEGFFWLYCLVILQNFHTIW